MTSPDIVDAIAPLVKVFDEMHVAYYIGGSVASSVYGIARSTMDVDIVADLEQRHVRDLLNILHNVYYVDEEAVNDALNRRSSFNLVHLETMIKVDVFVLKNEAYYRTAFGRRRKDTLVSGEPELRLFVASPEDVIVNKLLWYRSSGGVSERHLKDVGGILRIQGDALDMEYVRSWAAIMNIGDLLEKVLVEIRGQ
jgi:hypothetical protein